MSQLEEEMSEQLRIAHLTRGMEREYKFGKHLGPKGRVAYWRFDFAWPDYHIALEVEGSGGKFSRHRTYVGYEGDCRKYNRAVLDAWGVVRVTGKMVQSGEALETIRSALDWRTRLLP